MTEKGTASRLFLRMEQRLSQRESAESPITSAIALQLRLAQHIEGQLTGLQRYIRVSEDMLGEYQMIPGERPHSSTGEVVFVERDDAPRLALKVLLKFDQAGNFIDNPDLTYAFDDSAGRAMTAIGETLMGRAANKRSEHPLYFGVAGVTTPTGQSITLERLSMKRVIRGEQEPVIVMRHMDVSVADILLDKAENGDREDDFSIEDIEQLTREVVQQVIEASMPLPEDLAVQIGDPDEVEKLLTEKTIGWLTGREEQNEVVQQAIEKSRSVRSVFQEFFALPETHRQLSHRASGWVGENGNQRLAQTFSPGDTKLGNILMTQTPDGQTISGLFDPQWLVLKPGAIGNDEHMFAPWPFADLMQITAFTATQPTAYGFPEIGTAIVEEVKAYYGAEHWSDWHDLYFAMLTAYKLLVDVAYNIDSYMIKVNEQQPISRSLRYAVEVYPQTALELATSALEEYRNKHAA
jgi:hypothetical protein